MPVFSFNRPRVSPVASRRKSIEKKDITIFVAIGDQKSSWYKIIAYHRKGNNEKVSDLLDSLNASKGARSRRKYLLGKINLTNFAGISTAKINNPEIFALGMYVTELKPVVGPKKTLKN